jgi:hypothetical protein
MKDTSGLPAPDRILGESQAEELLRPHHSMLPSRKLGKRRSLWVRLQKLVVGTSKCRWSGHGRIVATHSALVARGMGLLTRSEVTEA